MISAVVYSSFIIKYNNTITFIAISNIHVLVRIICIVCTTSKVLRDSSSSFQRKVSCDSPLGTLGDDRNGTPNRTVSRTDWQLSCVARTYRLERACLALAVVECRNSTSYLM